MEPHVTLPQAASAQRYAGERVWCEDTFYSLPTTHATEWPDAAALQDAGEALTWGKLRRWTCSVAANLREYGLVRGDCAMKWLSNRIEAVVMFLACAREGIACNLSVHKTYTCAEVGDRLNTLSARALLTEDGWGIDRATIDYGWSIIRAGHNIYPSHWLLSYGHADSQRALHTLC